MLIRRQDLERIARGEIALAFRRWKRPTVRAGGSLRTAVGVLAIESVDKVREAEITTADARAAGFTSRAVLVETLRSSRSGELYRIALHLSGPDPRAALRQRAEMTAEELAEVSRRLARFDKLSPKGPWTRMALRLIAENPGTRAADLADSMDRDKGWFKTRVRRLKELGLTESLETGYRLSQRGKSYWRSTGAAEV